MIEKESNPSMIINEQDASMIEVDCKDKPSFLNRYVADMRKT